MNWLTPVFFFIMACLHAGEAQPFIFSGVVKKGASVRVALTAAPAGESKWVDVGGEFQGYKIISYNETSTTLVVLKDFTESRILLQEAKIKSTSILTPEARNQIHENLAQLWTAARKFFLDKNTTSAVFSDLVGKGKYIESLESVCGENYAALVFSPDSKSITVSTPAGELISYTDVFYAVKPGDTLATIARVNRLSLTDLLALNPEVSWTKLHVGQVVVVGAEQK